MAWQEARSLREEEMNEDTPTYFVLLEAFVMWCEARAAQGDVSVETLAYKFADNVVAACNSREVAE